MLSGVGEMILAHLRKALGAAEERQPRVNARAMPTNGVPITRC